MKQLIDIKIPKGTKCANGICEQDIELKDLEINLPDPPKVETIVSGIPEIIPVNQPQPKPEVKPQEKEPDKPKTVLENFIPAYTCKNGKCGLHNNENYTQLPKGICGNCGQFNLNESGPCRFCGKDEVEELEKEKLEELEIIMPEEKQEEHDHGHGPE